MRYAGGGILFCVLVGYLLTGVTQIFPGERAVVRRFGRVLEEQPKPGLWIGLPWGLDRVDRVAVHLIRSVEVGYPRDVDPEVNDSPPGQLMTGDHNLINLRVQINYTVDEAGIVDYVMHRDESDDLIARAGESLLSEWVAGQTVDAVLVRGKAELPGVITARLPGRLDGYELGVVIRSATVDLLNPPEEVRAAFENVTRAQSGIRTQEFEARQQASRRLKGAEAVRFEIEQRTAAWVNEQHILAAADAERFARRLAEYRRSRDNQPGYLVSLWWEEMSALYARMKAEGRVDVLDNHIAGDGLDVAITPTPGRK